VLFLIIFQFLVCFYERFIFGFAGEGRDAIRCTGEIYHFKLRIPPLDLINFIPYQE